MKLLKWLLVVLGLTVIAVLALLTASNVQAQEGLVGDWVLDAAASKSPVPQLAPTAGCSRSRPPATGNSSRRARSPLAA